MAPREHDVGSGGVAVAKPHPRRIMSEEEFLNWCDEETRAEWVDGTELSVRINSRRRLPDVLFVASDRADRLRESHFEGAPNLIIEVISDDSVDRDWRVKYLEYQAAGVDEYWVVDPLYQRIEGYSLGADKTYRSIAPVDGRIASRVVPGFYLQPEWPWQRQLPKVPSVLKELLGRPEA